MQPDSDPTADPTIEPTAEPMSLHVSSDPVGAVSLVHEAEDTKSDELIDELARELHQVVRDSLLLATRMVGRRILEVVFDGDIEKMRQRGVKDASLRKLAEHPCLDTNATHLHQAVNIYHFTEQHPQLLHHEQLTTTHFRVVMPLPDAVRLDLPRPAARDGWSTARLENVARGAKKRHCKGRGGRPRLPTIVKTVNALKRYARSPDQFFGGMDELNQLPLSKARKLREIIGELRTQLDVLDDSLESHLEELGVPPEQGPVLSAAS